MKIHSFGLDGNALANIETNMVPDTANKATALYTVFAHGGSETFPFTVSQSAEGLAEMTTGGHVRVMFKTTLKFPKIKQDPLNAANLIFGPAQDSQPAHIVLQLPQGVAQMFANEDPNTAEIRAAYATLILKQLLDLCTMIRGSGIVDVAPNGLTGEQILGQMFAPTAPLRRAVASLNPLDTSTGVYGTLYAP